MKVSKQDVALAVSLAGLILLIADRQQQARRDAKLVKAVRDPGSWKDTVLDDVLNKVPGGQTVHRLIDSLF